MKRVNRSALTLLEALVVTVVVGIAVALIIVGLSLGRERMRRSRCQGNLRQLGLALQGYHQAHGMLPPAALRDPLELAVSLRIHTSAGQPYQLRPTCANWAILLLPHLGQQGVGEQFDLSVPVTDPANAKPRVAELAAMSCPSDAYRRADNAYRVVPQRGPESLFARGNYAINGGVGDTAYAPGRPWDPAPNGTHRDYLGSLDSPVERIWSSGIAGFNRCFSVDDFESGLSNVVGVDEVRAGLTPDDSRGVWALGAVGASVTWGHGLVGDSPGPNCRRPRSDDIIGCNQVHEALGEAGLIREGMPCCSYAPSEQATARSMHPAGVNVMMMDGSARFISDDVDLNLWHAIHSRETRDVAVPADCQPPDIAADAPPLTSPRAAHPLPKGIELFNNSFGMTLARIPAGEFIMGLPDAGKDIGDPVSSVPPDVSPHRVRIRRDFYIGAFEVTQAQYERVMGRSPSWHSRQGGGAGEMTSEDTSQFPVEQVTWVDAVEFCCRLSATPEEKVAGRRYRLPTEAEWEYACRSGSTVPFDEPSGEAAGVSGFNVRADSSQGLPVRAVGSYAPSAFGLYDMRGNVMEWCADWFGTDYYKHSSTTDPIGPASGVLRVVRGADWRFTGMGCHYSRYETEPWRTSPYIGFRVVCEAVGR